MKNVPIMPLALVATIAAFTSCSKSKYTNTDQVAALGKATISGKAYAELDATNTTIEYAPSGTKIRAWVYSRDLVIGDTTGLMFHKKYATDATVEANGKFTFNDIPVSKYDSVWVTLVPQSFSASYKFNSSGTVKTETRTYKASEFTFKKIGVNQTDTTAAIYYMN